MDSDGEAKQEMKTGKYIQHFHVSEVHKVTL